jgi:uncharacterized protein
MDRRILVAMLVVLAAAWQGAQAGSHARAVPARRCAEPPLSVTHDPSDPESVKKNLRTAPRIVLAMGLTRHEKLRSLLARGENPNVCVLGNSVLTLAAASGDLEEVEILLDGGAHPDRPADSLGGTPLMMALDQGRFDVARLLIDRGADVRAATDGNMTTLIELAGASPPPELRAQQLELAQALVDGGVAVDARLARPRTTALMMASIRGNAQLVQLLLHLGADPRLEDSKGQTALTFALKKGHADVAALLSAANPAPAAASEAVACAASGTGPCPTEPRKSP